MKGTKIMIETEEIINQPRGKRKKKVVFPWD